MSKEESALGQTDDSGGENLALINNCAYASFLFLEISSNLLAFMKPKIGGKLYSYWINYGLST